MVATVNGEEVRRRRAALNLSREQLAVKAGVSGATVIRTENSTHEPSITTLGKLALVLGCSVSDLLLDPGPAKAAVS